MVGSFVRFLFTRCEESLNSLVHCAHSFAALTRSFVPLTTREEKSSALTNHEVTSISTTAVQIRSNSSILRIIFTPHGRYELNKLTSLPMCGFIAQLIEHRTGIAEVTI